MAAGQSAPTAGEIRAFRRRLLRWYRGHGRELPWRASPRGSVGERPDPYHVLVSEAMLQQTQVETVKGYFRDFIAQFPTLHHLARAEEGSVLRAWQGLGYYRRARHLHAAAQQVVEGHGGVLPSDPGALRALPGIGPYSAGAIASIAYDRAVPSVDGNVARVLARWGGVELPTDEPTGRAAIQGLAGTLMAPHRPGAFNQALMDLGARICRKRQPLCRRCPLAPDCRSRADGKAAERPRRSKRVKPRPASHTVVAIRSGDRFLYERRPDTGLWAGMWQLPTMEPSGEPDRHNPLEWVRNRFGWSAGGIEWIGDFRHLTTHRSIRFTVGRASVDATPSDEQGRIWRCLGDHDDLPLANPQRRAVAMLRDASLFIETESQ